MEEFEDREGVDEQTVASQTGEFEVKQVTGMDYSTGLDCCCGGSIYVGRGVVVALVVGGGGGVYGSGLERTEGQTKGVLLYGSVMAILP